MIVEELKSIIEELSNELINAQVKSLKNGNRESIICGGDGVVVGRIEPERTNELIEIVWDLRARALWSTRADLTRSLSDFLTGSTDTSTGNVLVLSSLGVDSLPVNIYRTMSTGVYSLCTESMPPLIYLLDYLVKLMAHPR